MSSYNIAIVGATGAVGEEILRVLDEMNFPVKDILPLASAKSAGEKVEFRGKEYVVRELTDSTFGALRAFCCGKRRGGDRQH